MLISVLVSVLVAGEGLTIVVFVSFFSVFSAGGLVTVVSFCSQAAKSTAPIKRQMHLFISVLDVFGCHLFKASAKGSSSWSLRGKRLPPGPRFQFSVRKPREARRPPGCKCISS